MGVNAEMPAITPELAQAVTRLGHIRRQMRDLETEEALLREEILSVVEYWPRDVFPLRVGAFEVRVGERKGRIDLTQCLSIMEREHLLAEVPREPVIVSHDGADELRRALTRLDMPESTREALVQAYKAAIDWKPDVSFDVLTRLADEARLSPEEYKSCFKEGKPTVTVLTVR
ncbi:hypothetical protein [Sulfobacillus harzensis]|uniref:Uncharacterized protein n=1 Tax=Sulfobacillus harzensis TaxID=2729629 RepID=A0A7Y0Q1Y6_9FIRM|nr:hypothetical protein [Sulfobacillus harzensis]NMP21331.1 hypothetical protein [Sulfobacillus harzensis]